MHQLLQTLYTLRGVFFSKRQTQPLPVNEKVAGAVKKRPPLPQKAEVSGFNLADTSSSTAAYRAKLVTAWKLRISALPKTSQNLNRRWNRFEFSELIRPVNGIFGCKIQDFEVTPHFFSAIKTTPRRRTHGAYFRKNRAQNPERLQRAWHNIFKRYNRLLGALGSSERDVQDIEGESSKEVVGFWGLLLNPSSKRNATHHFTGVVLRTAMLPTK